MRLSNYYIPTLKEAPSDAEVISHKLLIRSGMIRKLTAGLYSYLPLGWKTIRKVEEIIRQEMNKAGSMELRLPSVQPGDLWVESGRWEQYGRELLRFKDRNDRDYCLGPTHEEVITDLIRGEIRSYRQMPINFFQMQTKFRDEIRPRFGLMRGREFIMKDAYSFDKDDEGADISYKKMYEAYQRIFKRLGLKFRAVEADTGSIGGTFSHEFMVLAQTGEDTIISCSCCDYAANIERAQGTTTQYSQKEDPPCITEIFTPKQHTVQEIITFLGVTSQDIIKTVLLEVDNNPVAILIRGDREYNEIKVKNYLNASNVKMATPSQVEKWTNAPVGFAGPVDLNVPTIVADLELHGREGWITGANKKDTHLQNVSLTRDVKLTGYADLRNLTTGDACPKCGKPVIEARGIEVGHIFKLGTKYSKEMNAVFLNEKGEENLIIMGCYGIGITRVVAACVEQNNDDNGIVFPPPVSPFDVVLLNLDPSSDNVNQATDSIYEHLQKQGIDVLLDDRNERPGIKFKDADLIGVPLQLIVGSKSLKSNFIEAKDRRTGEKTMLSFSSIEDFLTAFTHWKTTVYSGWSELTLS